MRILAAASISLAMASATCRRRRSLPGHGLLQATAVARLRPYRAPGAADNGTAGRGGGGRNPRQEQFGRRLGIPRGWRRRQLPSRSASYPSRSRIFTQQIERLEARLGEGGGVGGGGVAVAGAPGHAQAGSGLRRVSCPGFEDKQPLAPLAAPAAPAYTPRQQQSAVAPHPAAAAASGPARALFDQGYGALNRREYSAAEGFSSSFSNNIRPIRSRAVRNIGLANRRSSAGNTRRPPTAS